MNINIKYRKIQIYTYNLYLTHLLNEVESMMIH